MPSPTTYKRLEKCVQDCAYVNADPDKKFSQKIKDDIRTLVNKLLDYVIAQLDPRHIEVLVKEEEDKRLHKKLDDMRKKNLERLEQE